MGKNYNKVYDFKPNHTGNRCRICLSPYRKEIEKLVKADVPISDVVRIYWDLHVEDYKAQEHFVKALRKHFRNKHPPSPGDIVKTKYVENKELEFKMKRFIERGTPGVSVNPKIPVTTFPSPITPPLITPSPTPTLGDLVTKRVKKVVEQKKVEIEEDPDYDTEGEDMGDAPKSIDDYAEFLLRKGFTDPNVLSKISPATIIQAQKILMERDKKKEEMDLLRNTLFKVMAGLLSEEDITKLNELVEHVEYKVEKDVENI